MDIHTTTRRSFMKKTTALAVGISATTLFSGLVHATGLESCGVNECAPVDTCKRVKNADGTDGDGYTCTLQHRNHGPKYEGWCMNSGGTPDGFNTAANKCDTGKPVSP